MNTLSQTNSRRAWANNEKIMRRFMMRLKFYHDLFSADESKFSSLSDQSLSDQHVLRRTLEDYDPYFEYILSTTSTEDNVLVEKY